VHPAKALWVRLKNCEAVLMLCELQREVAKKLDVALKPIDGKTEHKEVINNG
jgi:hypothetical protein